MEARPDPMTQHPTKTKPAGRGGNFVIAARRFGRTWQQGVASAAARRFMRLWPVWAGGVLLAVLAAMTIDEKAVVWARGLPAPVIGYFQWLTEFGTSGWLLYPLVALCLVLLVADWQSVGRRIAAAWTEVGIIAGFAFLSIAGSGILTNVFKQSIGRGRPVVFDGEGAFSLSPFQFDYAHAAFPSGHATTMGALAVIVAVVVPRWRIPAFAFCGLVASSRVIVGAHYPSDVVAGLLLGAAYTWFYALALSEAGIAFAREPSGPITARVTAIRGVFRPRRGVSSALGGLFVAVVGDHSRSGST